MEIYVDDRERAVMPYIEDLSQSTHINYVIKRMTTGDYAIVYNGHILVVIERKTLVDLASSLRDGRSKNVEKLINLRQLTACKIIYIIEGPLVTNSNALFARMPYKCLQAHIDHLAIRDNIHIINALDQEHTASRLFTLAANYMTIKPSMLPITELKTSEQLTASQTSMVSINEQILRCLPHVGCLISTMLAEHGITLQSLYLRRHDADQIARFKYATGSSIGLAKAEKIANIYKIIDSESVVNSKIHLRILTTIPLISKQTAEKILSTVTLADILNNNTSVEILSAIDRSEKTKLGHKAAVNIINYLTTIESKTQTEQKPALTQTDKPIMAKKPALTQTDNPIMAKKPALTLTDKPALTLTQTDKPALTQALTPQPLSPTSSKSIDVWDYI